MKISFRDKKLEALVHSPRKAVKTLGTLRTKILYRRLKQLSRTKTLSELHLLPGDFHVLTGNRKGQWACSLDQPYRLIFEPYEDGYIEVCAVEIIKIVDYH